MKLEYITKRSHHRLLLIFAGWSTDTHFYDDCITEGWDVAVVSGYTLPNIDLRKLDSDYSTIYMIAWSLGVAAAEMLARINLMPTRHLRAAFAVNGTLYPSSSLYGIPEEIYNATEASLSDENLRRFRRRMCTRRDHFFPLPQQSGNADDIFSLRDELRNLRDNIANDAGNGILKPMLPWRRAFIGLNDLIIPPQNQKHYWQTADIPVTELPAGHYIPLSEIAGIVMPEVRGIARRFGQATGYDREASVQREVARHLASRALGMNLPKHCRYLEIGPGSGFLTHALLPSLKPDSADFVDLALPSSQFGYAPCERYHQQDAEVWIEMQPDNTYDIVASASTMQWFADADNFLRNAARVLRPGGIAAISTYAEGNLGELDVLRPAPLPYLTAGRLREIASSYFNEVEVEEDTKVMQFESRRDMLMHLKHTGVGGSGIKIRNSITRLSERPTLTYRPVYLLMKKPRSLHMSDGTGISQK